MQKKLSVKMSFQFIRVKLVTYIEHISVLPMNSPCLSENFSFPRRANQFFFLSKNSSLQGCGTCGGRREILWPTEGIAKVVVRTVFGA